MFTEAVKKYIETCPLITKSKINVNYLGEKPVKYSIDNVPVKPIVKQYTDGGTLRQYLFVFASREAYDENALENMNTAQFFEEFEAWIEAQNASKNFPVINNPKVKVTKIETLTSGYLFDSDSKTARFQIQCKITYKKEV
ncbi:MAG: hypothetical protein J6B23_04360 [Clostridia bacterium]|nr:hypothetical protein [Clostridia bacterium]